MIRQDLAQYDIPQEPGVYFWRDETGTVLYIGKATVLRDRIKSYFSSDLIHSRGPHIVDMVFRAKTITWQTTASVLEAVILEANLIKKQQPYYNTKEKDDKSFNCVVITKEPFPKVLIVRQKDIDTHSKTVTIPRYGIHDQGYDSVFGPFPQSTSLRDAVKVIRRIFPFRDRVSAQKDKEVFYRQIALSPDVSSPEAVTAYKKTITAIKKIFEGKLQSLIKELQKEMQSLAKKELFEDANSIKQKIFALEHVQDIALIKRDVFRSSDAVFRVEAYDVAHSSGSAMVGVMTVVEDGQSDKQSYRKFMIKGFTQANDAGALQEMLVRRLAHTEWPYPQLIVVDGNVIQMNAAQTVLDNAQLAIPIVAVTKDERHRPKALSGNTKEASELIADHKLAILLANAESHRFAVQFHRQKRDVVRTKPLKK